jgi:hypothetical protein
MVLAAAKATAVAVRPVQLQQINVVCLQPPQFALDRSTYASRVYARACMYWKMSAPRNPASQRVQPRGRQPFLALVTCVCYCAGRCSYLIFPV